MDLTEKDLKDIENLLVKDNPNSLKERNSNKMNVFKHDFRQDKLNFNLQKLSKNKTKNKMNKIKFPKILLNLPTNTTESNNDYSSKLNISDNILIESQARNNTNNINNKSVQTNLSYNNNELIKKERSLIIKNIFDQIRRKSSKAIDVKSSNTDIKSYGELFPGPGYYNPDINNISHNLRYKNLFLNNSHSKSKRNLNFKRNKNIKSDINIGPGSYNPIDNFNYVSYAQNPKVFISSLGRPSFINENIINKVVGPGSYEVSSSFDSNRIKNYNNFSSNIIKENKKEIIKKALQNELNMINNTNFFNMKDNKKLIKLKKENVVENNNKSHDNKKVHIYNIISKDSVGNQYKYCSNIILKNSKKLKHISYKKNMYDKNNESHKICLTDIIQEKYKLPIIKGNSYK